MRLSVALFSYKKKDCLEGKEGEQAFNDVAKQNCFMFYQHSEDALLLENAPNLNTEDFASEIGTDLYIVDKQFRWTYVLTHETEYCGPYFCLNDK